MQKKGEGVRGRRKRFFYFQLYIAACLLFVIVQLFLGTKIMLVMMAFVSLILAGSILFYFGLYDIVALFAFGLLSKYSVLPFLIKSVMGERIDVGLLAVDKTFTVILVGSFLTLAALFAAKTVHIKKKLLDFPLSDKQLQVFGYLTYGLGFGLTMLHVLFKPTSIAGEVVGGFGGFGGFIGLLYLGVICITAHLAKTDSKRIINKSLVLMLAGALLLSFLDDAKLYFTLSLLAYIATLFLFGRKVTLRYVAGGLLMAVFYAGAVVPTIQVLRMDSFKAASLGQRADMVVDFVKHHVFESSDATSLQALLFHYDYYPNLHTPIIDRLEMVQDLDLVLDGVNSSNKIGWQPIPMALLQITPHFLAPNKIPYADVDIIGYRIGYMPTLMVRRRTMGLFGVSYAMFMWPGWMFISFALMFIFFLLIRKLVHYSAMGNIFGIYVLVRYGINFTEVGVENLIVNMLRGIPMDVITIFIILAMARAIVHKNPQRMSVRTPAERQISRP